MINRKPLIKETDGVFHLGVVEIELFIFLIEEYDIYQNFLQIEKIFLTT